MFRCLGVSGVGCRVQGLGFRVLGFWGLGSGVQGWMKMVWDESVIG